MIPINFEYDPDFLKEEVRDDYLVTEKTKKLWLVELDLLNKFIQVCNKYNLTYFADAGTLLGAVRHKGFIPWDDDVDIIMPRADFERLIEIADTEFTYPYYLEHTLKSYNHSFFLKIKRLDTTKIVTKKPSLENKFFSKTLCSISIDIFCLDKCPDTAEERSEFQDKISNAARDYYRALYKFNLAYDNGEITDNMLIKYRIGLKQNYYKFNKICQEYNDSDVNYLFNTCFTDTSMESFKLRHKEDYDGFVELPFEMLTLKCPKGYERCLDIMYTQRNGIPWTEFVKNYAFHNQMISVFFDFDNPYSKYMKSFYYRPDDLKNIPTPPVEICAESEDSDSDFIFDSDFDSDIEQPVEEIVENQMEQTEDSDSD